MIVWREKVRAFGVHFLVTLALSAAAAALVFLIWFPDPFQTMLGGTKLFGILLMCDLGLGPLTSLVIYNSKKSRQALLFDYTAIGIVQLAAFGYGLHTVAITRPVYIVFARDHLEVVLAGEIDDADLARGADGYRTLPKLGPRVIGIREPEDVNERARMLVEVSATGKGYALLPMYYVPYQQNLAQIKQHAMPVSELERRRPEAKPLVVSAAAQLQVQPDKLTWLTVKHPRGLWSALLDPETGQPARWLPVDPRPLPSEPRSASPQTSDAHPPPAVSPPG